MALRRVPDFLFENESYQIRGACFDVYNALGGGIKEKIIERALNRALENCGLDVKTQVQLGIHYAGVKIGTYIPDFIVSGEIILELKAKPFLTKEDKKQFWGYMKGSKYKLGFLVNFDPQKLTVERFVHTRKLLSA